LGSHRADGCRIILGAPDREDGQSGAEGGLAVLYDDDIPMGPEEPQEVLAHIDVVVGDEDSGPMMCHVLLDNFFGARGTTNDWQRSVTRVVSGMMRVVLVLLASTAAACSLDAMGDLGPSPDAGAGKDGSADVVAIDVRPPEDTRAERALDASVPRLDASPDHSKPPEDAASEVAPDVALTSPGDALAFDGGNYVGAGNVPIPTDFTIEAWIYPTATTGETYIVAEDEDGNSAQQFRFGLVMGGQLFFLMSDGSGSTHGLYGSNYSLLSSGPVPTNSWTHVAVTKDGADFALLIGGTEASYFTAEAAFSSDANVGLRVAGRVGSDGHSLEGGFQGTIDEVRFWSTPQSNASIMANMAHEIPTSYAGFSELLIYYRFDDASGSMAVDTSAHYTGTLVGTPLPAWVVSGAF
jgi:hypothetical protein